VKKYLLLAVSCSFCVALSYGQGTPTPNGWRFRSGEYAGMAIGEMGGYGLVETVNGLYKGPWFFGLGTGLDYYRFRTVPLFVSLTRDVPVASKKGGLYVLANGGINLPRCDRNPLPYGIGVSQFHPGIWWNTGLGYRWKLSPQSDNALLISAAYGVKKLSEHQVSAPQPGQPFDCPYCLMMASNTYDYNYVNHLWMLTVGFQF
jgi:hypothetical protein